MTMGERWKIVVLLVGIFAAGALAGGLATFVVGRHMARSARPNLLEQWEPQRFKMLSGRLGLTKEQEQKLRPILRKSMEDLAHVRQQGFTETRRVIDQMEKDVAGILTPEQQADYEKIKRESAERFRRMMPERSPGFRAPGGPEGGRRRFERGPGGDGFPRRGDEPRPAEPQPGHPAEGPAPAPAPRGDF